MKIQLKTKTISQNVGEIPVDQSLLKGKYLAIPSSKKGLFTAEKIFTCEHKRIVLHCEFGMRLTKNVMSAGRAVVAN